MFFVPPINFVSGYLGPGDVVPGAVGWWGLRAYTFADIGANAVRLREDGGNTESDFATIAGGGLDTSAISTFKGANNLFVVKVYDQVGSNDLEQATAANQPKFILSALGSRPAMEDNGSASTLLQSLNTLAFDVPPWTFSTVYEVLTVNDGMIAIGSVQAFPQLRVNLAGAANTVRINLPDVGVSASATDNAWHALQGVFGAATLDANVDGSPNTTANTTATPMLARKLDLFSFDNSSNYLRGYIGEVGFWDSDFSSGESSSMSANQHSYWGF
jgi:hypothetical protein